MILRVSYSEKVQNFSLFSFGFLKCAIAKDKHRKLRIDVVFTELSNLPQFFGEV